MMNYFGKKILTVILVTFSGLVMAAGGGFPLDKAPVDLHDKESLKRGAVAFADNCLSCHAASYMRYNRIGADLGMTDIEVSEQLISTRDAAGEKTKPGQLMQVAMNNDYSKIAFGLKIPDLSVIARARGADWLYTYLRTFYMDDSRPMGVNNMVFADVGMPHVLWDKQGLQKAVYTTEMGEDGNEHHKFEKMEMVQAGSMSTEEYDAFVGDLVNYLVYMAEPIQVERRSLGVKVIIFLVFFAVIAYLLKKEYWKDIH